MHDFYVLGMLLGKIALYILLGLGLLFLIQYLLIDRPIEKEQKKSMEETSKQMDKQNEESKERIQKEVKNAQDRLEKYYNSDLIDKQQFDKIYTQYFASKDRYYLFYDTFYENRFSSDLETAEKEHTIIKKKGSILRRYDKETADKILANKYWLGMTVTQLVESLGEPTKIKREESLTENIIRYCYSSYSLSLKVEFTIENDKVAKIVEK
ncbi:MAG: hypothetical protein U0U67_05815 [Chitinophagales bacterium]